MLTNNRDLVSWSSQPVSVPLSAIVLLLTFPPQAFLPLLPSSCSSPSPLSISLTTTITISYTTSRF